MECVRCGRRILHSEVLRRGAVRGCFKASIVEKTRKTISRFGMLRHGEKVGVAVFGGKDSLAPPPHLHALSGRGDTSLLS